MDKKYGGGNKKKFDRNKSDRPDFKQERTNSQRPERKDFKKDNPRPERKDFKQEKRDVKPDNNKSQNTEKPVNQAVNKPQAEQPNGQKGNNQQRPQGQKGISNKILAHTTNKLTEKDNNQNHRISNVSKIAEKDNNQNRKISNVSKIAVKDNNQSHKISNVSKEMVKGNNQNHKISNVSKEMVKGNNQNHKTSNVRKTISNKEISLSRTNHDLKINQMEGTKVQNQTTAHLKIKAMDKLRL